MPTANEQGIKASNGGDSKISGSTATPKKKKNRQRDRIRNKKNRTSAVEVDQEAIIQLEVNKAATNSQSTPELIPPIQEGNRPLKSGPNNLISTNSTNKNRQVKPTANEMKASANGKPVANNAVANTSNKVDGDAAAVVPGKTREQVMAEREAKKLAKQAKKGKVGGEGSSAADSKASTVNNTAAAAVASKDQVSTELNEANPSNTDTASGKIRDQIKAEREAKKQAKQAAKVTKSSSVTAVTQQLKNIKIGDDVGQAEERPTIATEDKKKPVLTKAERRALQEAQRAVKAQAQSQKATSAGSSAKTPAASNKIIVKPSTTAAVAPEKDLTSSLKRLATTSSGKVVKFNVCKVKLFNHLESARRDVSLFVNNSQIHPSIARLGEQYATRTIVGSNARCIAFLNALKLVIQDFETPPKKEFARSLEAAIKSGVEHLQRCRPLAVSVSNAHKHIKHVLTQLPTDKPESELKENLCHFIDTYIENQIGKAAQAISSSMQEKIIDGDVILTFGCSSLINYICEEAQRRHVKFRVIVVDSRPFCEGQEFLRRLTAKEIPCTYVLINAVGYVMPEATKVLLGAHALLSNGYVMARTGTAQVALVARSFNVPVLVCCETHKFSERFQTDAIVYNELGNPDDLILGDKCSLANWEVKCKISPLNLIYDITPPELVTAVVTEVSILPCTSVPVILRIKPTEIGYYS